MLPEADGGRRIIPARAGFTATAVMEIATAADHPRSRGVYEHDIKEMGDAEGSSPLARGLPRARKSNSLPVGIIPARAGFTRPPVGRRARPGDHPRSRGVYTSRSSPATGGWGSSPLARGLPPVSVCPQTSTADHPRSRGVYSMTARMTGAPTGSSPLARGLLPTLPQRRPRRRIIPARAGFTWYVLGNIRGPYGSSPLARGLHRLGDDEDDALRIIPARAGFTRPSSSGVISAWDHPRSRGVYPHTAVQAALSAGSSPLARGLPRPHVLDAAIAGIIPARAGFTRSAGRGSGARRDHPRSRGVYRFLYADTDSMHGSSPLARGLPTVP